MKTPGEAVTDHRLLGLKGMKDRFEGHLGLKPEPEEAPELPITAKPRLTCFADVVLVILFLIILFISYLLFWR